MKIRDTIKDYVLANYDQAGMFSFYLSIPYTDIIRCLGNPNYLVVNPLRGEVNPSMGFRLSNGKIYAKDFGNDAYSGDIFHAVGIVINENCNTAKGFVNICSYIIKTYTGRRTSVRDKQSIYNARTTKIQVEKREWNELDKRFWLDGKMPLQYLEKRGVMPIQRAWINDMSVPYYMYSPNDLAYAYFFGSIQDLILFKLYFTNRTARTDRFRTNNRNSIEAGYQIKPANTLVLAKSFKDKLLIEIALIEAQRIDDFCVMSLSSEAVVLSNSQVEALRTMFNNVRLYVDYDKQGIVTGYFYKMLHGIETIYLPNTKTNFSSFSPQELVAINNKLGHYEVTASSNSFIDFLSRIDKSTTYEEKDFFDIARKDFDFAITTINKLL